MNSVEVKLMILSTRRKSVIEEFVRMVSTAPINRLLEALVEEFGDIPELRESENRKLFVEANAEATLEDYGVQDGSSLLILLWDGDEIKKGGV